MLMPRIFTISFFFTIWYQAASFFSRMERKCLPNLKCVDSSNLVRLAWNENGYKTWEHNGYRVNYVEEGDPEKPPVLLIHGFGASVYHWRYNIPALAVDHHVFAIDLLGFGQTDKPLLDYSAEIWRDQVLDFIINVIKPSRSVSHQMPCVVVGNSLGGFTALYASASPIAIEQNLINGCALLNSAGRFRSTSADDTPVTPGWKQGILDFIQRLVITASFYYTKQPARIAQVLRQVYIDGTNVDDELVQSIQFAARDPNAAEVFFRIVSRNGQGPAKYVDDLLADLRVPLLLLWGERDPWIRPVFADKIQAIFPSADRISLDAGHCPQDEVPIQVNKALREFVSKCG